MSESIDSVTVIGWQLCLLIGFILIAAIMIMIKLTLGSCYVPPCALDRRQDRKIL